MTLLVASLAGAFGAVCRYGVSGWVQRVSGATTLPVGTMVVNVVGSLALGAVIGTGDMSALAMASAGFLGGFTTFSTWMVETIRLGYPSRRALLNLILTVTLGIAAAAVGFSLIT